MAYKLVMYRGSWAATWRENGVTRRLALRTTDRDEAQRRLIDLTASEARKPTTVAQIVTVYLDRPAQNNRRAQELLLKAPVAYFGHMRPTQISDAMTRAYWATRQHVASGTIRTELQILIAALNHCDATGFKIPLPPAGKPRERVLSRREHKAIIKAARGSSHYLRLFVAILFSTGARKTAILQLTWDRVDLTRHRIDFRTGNEPNNKRRVHIPMSRRVRRYLKLAYRVRTCEYVIEHASQPIKDIKKGLGAIFARAGVSGASCHTARHTVATWMVERGVSLQDVAAFLGDTITTIERNYAKYSPDYLSGALKALD